jgi:acetoin utilization deacetylase AcuC-like enzyme
LAFTPDDLVDSQLCAKNNIEWCGLQPQVLIVSLGFDPLASDTARVLQLTVETLRTMGEMFGRLDLPVLLVREDGYDLMSLEKVATFLLAFAHSPDDSTFRLTFSQGLRSMIST